MFVGACLPDGMLVEANSEEDALQSRIYFAGQFSDPAM
jgi:hypothetical protein